jgi:LuxR family maltose regulon positive regulatory protein
MIAVSAMLLQTKLYVPPAQSTRIARPRLIAKLNAGVGGKLTLVAAPAGCGKTTLLADWLTKVTGNRGRGTAGDSSEPVPYPLSPVPSVAWLSLDELDNDPQRFVRYLIAALQTIDHQLGQTAHELLQAPASASNPPPSIEAVFTALINDLVARPELIVLVLDDYHVITAEPLHAAIAFLLDHLPPQMHIVISSRTHPPLPLARLRARSLLSEISAADLSFTLEETSDFLTHTMQLTVLPTDIARLVARTEGWIAGLQLAALSMQGREAAHTFVDRLSGSDRHIADFLMDEVLRRQPHDIQAFLLDTSVLTRFNTQLCDAVLGLTTDHRPPTTADADSISVVGRQSSVVGSYSQRLLEYVEQHNLFVIPLDRERHWYRYHHLFAEFLQARLQRSAPDRLPLVHARASAWYAAQGLTEEAIEHALTANAPEQAAALLEPIADTQLWQQGQITLLRRWFERLPPQLLLARLPSALGYARTLFASGQYDRFAQHLAALEPVVAAAGAADSQRWKGQYLVLQADLAVVSGELPHAETLFQDAHALIPATDVLEQRWVVQAQGYLARIGGQLARARTAMKKAFALNQQLGDLAGQLFNLYDLAEVCVIEGHLHAATQLYERMLRLAGPPEHFAHPVSSLAHLGLGGVLAEQNRLEEALAQLERALVLSQPDGFFGVDLLVYLTMARVHWAGGQPQAAEEALRKAAQGADSLATYTPGFRTFIEMTQAALQLQHGHRDVTMRWADALLQRQEDQRRIPAYLAHREQVTLSRFYLARQQVDDAVALLEQRRALAQHSGWGGSLIEIQILLALAEQVRQRPAAALDHLSRVLQAAEPEGYIRIFVDEGTPMAQLLRQALVKGIAPRYVGTLQAAFLPTLDAGPSHLEPLTTRERAVLRLVAAGLSNQEIADELIVAIGTVGKHTNTIFTKLGVRNRTQAVERARALGIL